MPDEVKEVQVPATKPKTKSEDSPAPTPESKPKPAKVKLKLVRAGSCNYGGKVLRKNEIVELEASQAEQFMKSGLFERL